MKFKTDVEKNFISDERGLVSFIVTLLIMVILSLLVIGFTNLTRREQRQALDKQLQTQAFYAAESGVNDAIKALDDYMTANPGIDPPSKDDCSNTVAPWNNLSPNLEADQSVQYTCVLVNPTPPDVTFDEVGFDSKVAPLNTGDGSPFNSMTFTWQNSETNVAADINDCDSSGGASDGSLPVSNQWGCSVGILRVDLVPTPAAGFDRAFLISNVMTAFFYPSSTADPNLVFANAAGVNQGVVVRAGCSGNPAVCTATVSLPNDQARYMVRLRSIYQSSQVTVTSVGETFRGAQAIVDSTGKAQDVLRRIKVRKPIGTITNPLLADYTIESTNICKRYSYVGGASGSVSSTECPIN